MLFARKETTDSDRGSLILVRVVPFSATTGCAVAVYYFIHYKHKVERSFHPCNGLAFVIWDSMRFNGKRLAVVRNHIIRSVSFFFLILSDVYLVFQSNRFAVCLYPLRSFEGHQWVSNVSKHFNKFINKKAKRT